MTILDFQNIKYSIRITRYYEKWKSRSENLYNYNEFGAIFNKIHEKSPPKHCNHKGFLMMIFDF